jgi:hypothetical protein
VIIAILPSFSRTYAGIISRRQMMLAESKSQDFDKPPSWFAKCCWFYSLIWAGFGGLAMLLATSFGMDSTKAYAPPSLRLSLPRV